MPRFICTATIGKNETALVCRDVETGEIRVGLLPLPREYSEKIIEEIKRRYPEVFEIRIE